MPLGRLRRTTSLGTYSLNFARICIEWDEYFQPGRFLTWLIAADVAASHSFMNSVIMFSAIRVARAMGRRNTRSSTIQT